MRRQTMSRPMRSVVLVIAMSMALYPAPFWDMARQLASGPQALLARVFDLNAMFPMIGTFI